MRRLLYSLSLPIPSCPMATLTVQLPEGTSISLLCAGSTPASALPHHFHVADSTQIHSGSSATIYRGALTSGEDEKTEDVVLKMIFGTSMDDLCSLEKEYELYRKMEYVQGYDVPTCYGLFRAPDAPIACLVLEFCGEPLTCRDFDEIPMDMRYVSRFDASGVQLTAAVYKIRHRG